jgi:LEA14-like dessication related protein
MRPWGLASIAALAVATSGCGPIMALVGKPRITDVRPRVTRLNFRGVDLAFDVDVKNPYPVPLNALVFRYGLEIEGEDFLKGEEPVDLELPSRGVGTVTFPASITYRALWTAYRKLKDAKEASYRLHGTLVVTALGRAHELGLSKAGTAPVLHAPKLEGLRVSTSPVTWYGADVTLRARLRNPNAFPVGVHDLRYQLRLGDVDVGGLTATTDGSIGPGERGALTLVGRISATGALLRIARGAKPGKPELILTGGLETPYGNVDLNERPIVWKPLD